MITRREDLHNTWVDVTKDYEVAKLFAAIYDKDALFRYEISKPYNELACGNPCVAISIDSRGVWAKHTDKPFHPTLREVTMKDFTLSNDVKYYEKDEEVKLQDRVASDGVKISYKKYSNSELKDLQEKTNHKRERFQHCYAKIKEELMSDNNNALDKAVKEVLEKTHNEIMSVMPRTKTEYIKLNKNDKDGKFWEVARDFSEIEGIAFYFLVDDSYLPIVSNQRLLAEFGNGNLYRKVEKQITWHDDVIDYLESFGGDECKTFIEAIMGNKNAGVNGNHYVGFINMCKLVVDGVNGK